MDARRLGRFVRALRIREGWRQADLAARATVSQDMVSRLERGKGETLAFPALRAILGAVDVQIPGYDVRWSRGIPETVLDEGHSRLVGATALFLERSGWTAIPEVTYSRYGERGSIDLLGWHSDPSLVLVVEVKTELASIEAMLRKLDEKVRLAPSIGRERFGAAGPALEGPVSAILVLPSSTIARRRVAGHHAVLDRALPARSDALRRWLRKPSGRLAGILFLPLTHEVRGRRRVRVRRSASRVPADPR